MCQQRDTNFLSNIRICRDKFPCGLYQPQGAFRFSADALILGDVGSRYINEYGYQTFADLGTGCGIIALSLLLKNKNVCGIGVERESELVEAAVINAKKLGVDARFKAVQADVGTMTYPESVDIVLANPPWRIKGDGRLPSSRLRQNALFGDDATLCQFALAARKLLKVNGHYLSIIGTEYMDNQQKALADAGFGIEYEYVSSVKSNLPPRFAIFVAVRQ